MTQLYSRPRPTSPWRKLALAALLTTLAGSTGALAQALNYSATGASNVAGTYTDLGTTGTAITVANLDDDNSAAQPIGFTFSYNGQSFTQFVLNTNGVVRLGAAPPSDVLDDFIFSTDPADVNILAPFLTDLVGTAAAGSEFRVATTGTAPNRVCTIQWKNLTEYVPNSGNPPAQFSGLNFQVKLYETTNNIEFVYGPSVAGTGAAAAKDRTVGIKGSDNNAGQVVLATKTAATAWSGATFLNDLYTTVGFQYDKTALPDPGRTYRFTAGPVIANDAEVRLIYSVSKLPRTAAAGHAVQAVVRNLGANAQSGVPVTLTVAGANTFTSTKIISSLAPGASTTVTFDPYPAGNLGTNTLTVALPLADDVPANNTKTYSQQVTSNVYSYATNAPVSTLLGIPASSNGTPIPSGAFVVKYTTAANRVVTGANIQLETSANSPSVGRTVFAVVLNSAGAVIGRTPDYVIQTADLGTSKAFTFPTAVPVTTGDFYVGLAQVNPNGSQQFFPLALQAENPTRPGTFFGIIPLNATGTNQLQDLAAQNFGIFMIDAVLNMTTGVSKALESAVSLYPNPSHDGVFTLELRGTGAQNAQVEVSNTLGQRVYSGTLKGLQTRLDLSQLANGLYTLKLSQGDQYMTRTISIRK